VAYIAPTKVFRRIRASTVVAESAHQAETRSVWIIHTVDNL